VAGQDTDEVGLDKFEALNDGTGQGNKIAYFDTYVQGICAQLDLWRSSPNYRNKRFEDAIAIWSGHNSVEQYIAYVLKRVPGMTRSDSHGRSVLGKPMGLAFLKAQAGHEAGKPYPAPDNDWLEAQQLVMGDVVPTAHKNVGDLIVVGDSGPGVSELQRLLGCKITGTYGDDGETEFALKLFQIRNALDPDGKCGKMTWGKLREATS
jgi:peptidoglycan hydrolase-like protein with peptidoglycan-binding domain